MSIQKDKFQPGDLVVGLSTWSDMGLGEVLHRIERYDVEAYSVCFFANIHGYYNSPYAEFLRLATKLEKALK